MNRIVDALIVGLVAAILIVTPALAQYYGEFEADSSYATPVGFSPLQLQPVSALATSALPGKSPSRPVMRLRRVIAGDEVDVYDLRGTELLLSVGWADQSVETLHIVAWYDQTGHGWHAIQTVASSQPTLQLADGSIRFDGLDDFLLTNPFASLVNDLAIFALCGVSSTAIVWRPLCAFSNYRPAFYVRTPNATGPLALYDVTTKLYGDAVMTTGLPHSVIFQRDAGQFLLTLNGQQSAYNHTSTVATLPSSVVIGNDNTSGMGTKLNGFVSKFYIFDRALTAGEVADLHNHSGE